MAATAAKPWYDKAKYRRCEDGSVHEGRMELVTWDSESEIGERLGWGAIVKEEADGLKEKFEKEFGGDEEKLFEYWPIAFRWTCCGSTGGNMFGCDHHGRGSTKCGCDFCKMGKPIPDSIHDPRTKSAHGKGLVLPRGPDPRSYDAANVRMNEMMRRILCLP